MHCTSNKVSLVQIKTFMANAVFRCYEICSRSLFLIPLYLIWYSD